MAATTTQTEEHVSLKLLLNEKGNKVLFAEAGKDFVDILCSFFTMPLGTIARLAEKDSNMGPVTVGCLNSLYHSVADLDEGCMWNPTIKQMLLQPINSAEDYCSTLKLNIDDTHPTKYFVCNNYDNCVNFRDLTFPTYKDKHNCRCGNPFTLPVIFKHFRQGFVNSVATFVITDDLTVMPNGIDYTSFSLLQELGIKNPSSVKEVVLKITKEKGRNHILGVLRFSSSVEISGKIQIFLKLVIRKSDGKVLYAQGEQDFANLLLSFLTFPLGGIARIFGENCSLASINGLYKSIAGLNENKFMISKEAKNRLVDPCVSPQIKLSKQIIPILEPGLPEYYGYYQAYNIICAQFFKPGEDKSYTGNFRKMNFYNMGSPNESYVKGPSMYVATDDLSIIPLSPISALALLNRLKTPLNDLKEKVLTIGIKECLSILNASLTSTSALTNGLAHVLTEVKNVK